MNPVESLKSIIVDKFNELAIEIQNDLNNPKKILENPKLEYPPVIKEYLDSYNQSRIRKRTIKYNNYLKLYEEKKNNPEFEKFENDDFDNLIKNNREFKKLLDSL